MTEKQYEELGEKILKAYTEAENEILRRVANRLAKGITQQGWTERKAMEVTAVRKEIEKAIAKAHEENIDFLNEAVTTAYGESQQKWMLDNSDVVKALGIDQLHPNSEKVARILTELDSNFNAAERSILRSSDDAYAKVIGETSALIATGVFTERQAVDKAMQQLADQGITDFVDRDGHHWNLGSYCEMATLTAIERASRDGYIDTMQEFGQDLVILSEHEGACPICEAWEGVIMSISGNDPNYPSLDEAEGAGVFHPRCMHDIYAYYPEINQGPLRSSPREIQEPSEEYTARSVQRYMERQVRHWKSRMSAAVLPQTERQAYNKVREWQEKLREHIKAHADEALPRKYWREGGRVTLRLQE